MSPGPRGFATLARPAPVSEGRRRCREATFDALFTGNFMTSRRSRGFTLIELLVSIGIIAVLAAFLFPSLKSTREKAQRTLCANRLRQLAAAAIHYGTENHGHLPDGSRDNDIGEHCIWVSHGTYNVFMRFLGRPVPNKPVGQNPREEVVSCPNLFGNDANPLPYEASIGWVIGYNYLGDHKMLETQNHWVVPSPVRLTDRGSLPLFSDLNDWSPQDRWTIVPHQKGGGGGFFYGAKGGGQPHAYGAAGGNVAFLDGSVQWRIIGPLVPDPVNKYLERAGEMIEYYTAGAPGTVDDAAYRGLW